MKKNKKLRKTYYNRRCLVCSHEGCDPCHIKSRGAGGPDKTWNIIPLCRKHHSQQHSLGWQTFLNRYPEVWSDLKDLGWEKIGPGKLWNRKLLKE